MNTVSLFTIILHLAIEIKSWVSLVSASSLYNTTTRRSAQIDCLYWLTSTEYIQEDINTFIKQGCNKLIKSDSKDNSQNIKHNKCLF